MKIHFKLKHSSVIEKTKPVPTIQKSNRETQQEINSKLRQANGFAGESIYCNFIAIFLQFIANYCKFFAILLQFIAFQIQLQF